MGVHIIKMPDIGEGIAEVELVAWHVAPGDAVTEDQVVADVMTDKATVEIPSPVSGKVLELGGQAGEVMAVGSALIRIEIEGAGSADSPAVAAAKPATSAPAPPPAKPAKSAPAPQMSAPQAASAAPARVAPPEAQRSAAPRPAAGPAAARAALATRPTPDHAVATLRAGERALASPAVRRRALEMGIELRFVPGTGPAGRVLHDDLDAYAERQTRGPGEADMRYAQRHGVDEVPVIGLRRKIAQKMQEAKRRIPHFSYVEELDVTELEALRARLNATHAGERAKLTVLPFLMRAIVLAVRDFPQVNARYDDDGGVLSRHRAVHIGIATQTPSGLMVPVVRHAEMLDPWESAAEVARLAQAAREGKASRDELSGSTITISSLGATGGIVSTPIINHPEVAIVGVNRIVERPMIRAGAVVPRLMMNLSSSFDHRVVDGADGAEFVQALRGYLESPATLFLS